MIQPDLFNRAFKFEAGEVRCLMELPLGGKLHCGIVEGDYIIDHAEHVTHQGAESIAYVLYRMGDKAENRQKFYVHPNFINGKLL